MFLFAKAGMYCYLGGVDFSMILQKKKNFSLELTIVIETAQIIYILF